jgi:hypothetical protein
MANTVEGNVKVNVDMDFRQNVMKQFSEVNSLVLSAMNDTLKVTDDQINLIFDKIVDLMKLADSSDPSVTIDQLNNGIGILQEKLAEIIENRDFNSIYSGIENIQNEIDNLDAATYEDIIETTREWYAELLKIRFELLNIGTLPEETINTLEAKIQTLAGDIGKIMAAADFSKTSLESDGFDSGIEASLKEISDFIINGLNNPLNVTDDQLASVNRQMTSLRYIVATSGPSEFTDQLIKSLDILDSNIKQLVSNRDFASIYNEIERIGNSIETFSTTNFEKVTEETQNWYNELDEVLARLKGMKGLSGSTLSYIHDELARLTSEVDNIKEASDAREKNADAARKESEANKESTSIIDKYIDKLKELQGLTGKSGKLDFAVVKEAFKNLLGGETSEKTLNDMSNQFNVPVDSIKEQIKSVQDALSEFLKTGSLSETTVTSITAALGPLGAAILIVYAAFKALNVIIKLVNEAIKLLDKGLKLCIETCKKVIDTFGDGLKESFDFTIDILDEFKDIVEDVIDKVKELSEAGEQVEDAYYQMSALIGSDATDSLSDFADELERIQGISSTNLMSTLNDITAATAAMGLGGEDLVSASEALTLVGQNLSIFAGSFEQASADLGNAISKGYIGRASSLYKVFTKNELTEFKSLNSELERYNYILARSSRISDMYNNYLETSSGKIEILRQRYTQLMNNVGLIAMKIYAAVAPILTNILNVVNGIVEGIMKLFNIEPESVNLNSVADNISESLKNVGDSAADASKKTASFDDVIQLDSDDTTSSLDKLDYNSVQSVLDSILNGEEKAKSEWDLLIEQIQKDLAKKNFFAAGRDLVDFINNKLASIKWDEVKQKATEAGRAIAEFINGVTSNKDLAGNAGMTLAELTNTIFTFLDNIAKTLDFRQLGEWLGAAWKNFWNTLDASQIGSTLYDWFIGIFDLVSGWLSEGGFVPLASKLAEIINNFFGNISEDDIGNIADTIIGVLDNVFEAIDTFLSTLDSKNIKEKILDIVSKLVNGFKTNARDWGETLGSLVKGVLDLLISIIGTADKSGLSSAIEEFLDGLDLSGILIRVLGLKLMIWWNVFRAKLSGMWDILSGLIEKGLSTSLSGAWTIISNWITKKLDWIKEKISGLNLSGTIGTLLNNIINTLSNGWNGIQTWIDTKLNWIKEKISKFDLSEAISTVINNVLDALKKGLSNITEWLGNVIPSGLTSLFSTKNTAETSVSVPKLANGQIATRATIVKIDDDARIPLDSNTQWMDRLANKLASKIKESQTQVKNNVTIDMSKCTKSVYTRSEMLAMGQQYAQALKLAGLNVSVVK